MTLHIFADAGLMLAETAGIDPGSLPGVRCTAYRQHRLDGPAARLWQLLHILARPFSLAASAWFARRFNGRLGVAPAQLDEGLRHIVPDDGVLWINPSLATKPLLEALMQRRLRVFVYFLDPVHRLGLDAREVRAWTARAWVGSYWPAEARRLGAAFVPPYAPAVEASAAQPRDLDVVYIGSPSPKRLLWVLALALQLRLRGARGHLRLAARAAWPARLLPRLFTVRLPYADYAALCRRSRGVLELHERDAGGVTLRATLCQAVRAVHLCNQPCTVQTVRVSWWRWGAMDAFLRARREPGPGAFAAPALDAPELAAWLSGHFR